MNGVNIQDFVRRGKTLLEEGIGAWGMLAIVFLACFSAFGLGRLSALEDARPPVAVEIAPETKGPPALPLGGYVVASRTGSTYYFPWCAGAQKITSANQVWFPSEAVAVKSGYRPAKNCKGLAGS